MAVDNSTQVVTATKSGTGWTIDVTNANLSTDLTVKDFLVEFESVVQDNSDFTKSSSTLLTYNGIAIPSSEVAVYRDTPVIRIQEVTYADRITSSLWEAEFNRMHRILAETGATIRLTESPVSSDDSTKVATTEWVRDLVGDTDSFRIINTLDTNLPSIGVPESGSDFLVWASGASLANDGDGGFFYWDEGSSATIDNVDVFQVDGDNSNGRWIRLSIRFGDLNVGSNLEVSGTTTLTGAITASSTLNISGNTTLQGSLNIQGTINDSTGDVTIGDNLDVLGAVSSTSGIDSNETIAQTSDDTTVPTTAWVNDRSAAVNLMNQGRLSNHPTDYLLTGIDSRTDVSYTSNNLYFHRHCGDKIALYNGTQWELHTIPETPTALSLIGEYTGNNYPFDIFIYDNSGTLTLEVEEWASATARTSTLIRQNGVIVKSGATTRRYLGVCYLNSNSQIRMTFASTSGSTDYGRIYLRNVDNQIPVNLYRRRGSAVFENVPVDGNPRNRPASNGLAWINGVPDEGFVDTLVTGAVLSFSTRPNIQSYGSASWAFCLLRFWDVLAGDVYNDNSWDARSYHIFDSTSGEDYTSMIVETDIDRTRAGENVIGGAISIGASTYTPTPPSVNIYLPSTVLTARGLNW